MVTTMKKLSIILMGCLLGMATVFAQNTPSISGDITKSVTVNKTMSLHTASHILQKSYDARLRKIAFSTVVKAAKEGTPEAMHLMGMAYYTGMSVKRDFDLARRWFEAANRHGYLKSAYNLAMMYRLGIGVKQDFGKAYQYLCRAGEEGQSQAVYGRGYMHYKGLGCTQSYDEALKYFFQAAEKKHGYSMFMIGLCYRNGYGVERNNGEANFWLKKAADKKVRASAQELSTDTPENPLSTTMLRSASVDGSAKSAASAKIKKVRHALSSAETLQGTYTGTLATYDWSGQHVIKESPLEVIIEQNGSNIIASWKEDTLSTVVARGILTDTALVFTEATYSKRDHYHRTMPANWDFVQATLATVRDGKTINLAGNLQLYSPDTKEPGNPMYLILSSKGNKTKLNIDSETLSATLNTDPMVYPNPFVSQLNLSFFLDREVACSVSICTMNGTKVYEEPMGKLGAGNHRFQIELHLQPASYIVQLVYGNKTHKSIIIKK